ncbi:MAG: tRNA 4-thiouridine(8) synthase ThiI [Patescibacteria group bacterium]|nr:tRNA 4-thiouridine(8) synthase ThiI [Patescibacteria group bacterium]
MYTHIIVHYDEITLKGGNRPFFERVLVDNIREFLKDIKYDNFYKEGGKIILNINKNTDLEKIKKTLKNIPGISNFNFAVLEEKNLEKINKKTVELLKNYLKTENEKNLRQTQDDRKNEIKTFKIEARRADKKFALKSPEINAKVGEYVIENMKLKVDVHSPDLDVIIDIGYKQCYIYFEKTIGIGGLPVGTTGNLISLISGGIDSPVASFMMNKRGAKNIFVHFKNKTIAGQNDGQDKIEKLVKQLCKFQGKSKLYVIAFEKFQKKIIVNIPSKNRMIVYRRIMFKIAGEIAKKEKAKGFVTGDSLSQVASQTIDNISAIYNIAKLPIFPPLIGMNKQEIINIAEKIDTYNISILPYQDCCSFLIAIHPETRANLEEILKQENNIKIDRMINDVILNNKPTIIEL